jgi:hypothetical protein
MAGLARPPARVNGVGFDRQRSHDRPVRDLVVIGIVLEKGKVIPGFGQFIAA